MIAYLISRDNYLLFGKTLAGAEKKMQISEEEPC